MSIGKDSCQPSRLEQVKADLEAVKRELQRREEVWQRELDIAERVHRSMLPKPIRHPRIDIDVRYVPAEKVGGDYCQVLFPAESCCYVTMCDVTGHGIGSALLATRVSSQVRGLVFEKLHPTEIVQQLNKFVLENFAETDLLLTFFVAQFGVSTFFAIASPRSKAVSFAMTL